MSHKPKSIIQYDKTLPYIEDKDPSKEPLVHLEKDGINSYKIVAGRRPSKMLLVNKLRESVSAWRENDYPGATNTTKELFHFWFNNDHLVDGNPFKFWFAQREAIETLAYLFEVKKYPDLVPIIREFSDNFPVNLYGSRSVEIIETLSGERKVIRYFPELKQEGEQDLPEKNLLRYAFKMATGSGKTVVMALAIVWSYFNKIKEKDDRYADNFLVIAPNIIVYERLAKDFEGNKIFYKLPLIPKQWQGMWNIKVTLRDDDSPLSPSGNLIVDNIQQLYTSREKESTPKSIIDEILGRKPKKDLTKPSESLLRKIKKLHNLIVMNDEAHHVHDQNLQWHKTLMEIHHTSPNGLTLWLDFSATPKTQSGTYYPWIIVDYPLAQAVEDRIVKTPLIVHQINKKDPEGINKDNVIQKYGDWITVALERWKEHYKTYKQVGKKAVLFIMAERNDYADAIAQMIKREHKSLGLKEPDKEVLVIHVKSRVSEEKDTEIKISDKDLPVLRKLARDIDEPDNKVKIIVSNLMLREGWDVRNVTIVLGLRPFTAESRILPEQAIGRGLRLMKDIGPDYTQTLEIMGTKAFEDFVKELEKEGVGINVSKTPPPLAITIAPETSRLKYDIEIPLAGTRYTRNLISLDKLDPMDIPSLFDSDSLERDRKIMLKIDFMTTETEVHKEAIETDILPDGRELLRYITTEIMHKARLTGCFSELYPKVEEYILNKCFSTKIKDVDDKRVRKHLNYNTPEQQSVIDIIAKYIGARTVQEKESVTINTSFKLSDVKPFKWRRKHLRCTKTVFNFVPVYNGFEERFALFLDKAEDILKFSALASSFRIDYLSERGAIRFYYPDFVAVQSINGENRYWIIETKGREYEDTDRKEAAALKWCRDVTKQTGNHWNYIKIPQAIFDKYELKLTTFEKLVKKVRATNTSTKNLLE